AFPYSRFKSLRNVQYPLSTTQAQPPAFRLDLTPPFGALNIPQPNLKLPRTYQWNASFQQALGVDESISATYVGSVGRKLLRQNSLLTPSFDSVLLLTNQATSDYHSLQLQFQRRVSRGLQALVSYTWSHSIDIASADGLDQNPFLTPNPNTDRGSSDFDVRHSFSTAIT